MKYYVVDAFTDTLFKGNPAGVCVLNHELDAATMQNIAAENNLSETAFLFKRSSYWDLRWFTPKVEVGLCGHATLGSAFVIANFIEPGSGAIRFETKSGTLTVDKEDDLYILDFPSRKPRQVDVTPQMARAIGAPAMEAHRSCYLLLLVEDERRVQNLAPDLELIKDLTDPVIVTAKSDTVDFVSRFFAPGVGIAEDPVTGSAHTTLIPFWAERLNKNKMTALQLSKRGGMIFCENCGDRVKIAGKAVLYSQGEVFVSA